MLERVVGAHPTVVAGGPATVGEPVRGQGRLPVVPEEVAVQTGGDVVPREDLVVGAVPGDVPVGVEALGGHRVEPAVEHEALAPLLERAARAPDPLDDPADATVATRRDALGVRRRGIVPAHLRARLAEVVADQVHLALQLGRAVLPEPLERRVRLRHEPADRRGARSPSSCTCARSSRPRARGRAIPSVSSSISVGTPMRK